MRSRTLQGQRVESRVECRSNPNPDLRRKYSEPGRADARFYRDSPGDCPRSVAARVGQRLCGANTRNQVELTPAFIGIHRVIAQDRSQRGLGSATMGPRCAWILCANAREQTGVTRIACHMPSSSRGWRSASGAPSVILVMEPAEDRPGNNVLGWNTSHGRQPTCAERWLHAKTAVWSAMIVANVVLQPG
jgi:hypothetical protein